jgi:hypothetical protein
VVEEEVVALKVVQKDREHLVDHRVIIDQIVMGVIWLNRKKIDFDFFFVIISFVCRRTGSGLKNTAGSFAAGAVGGIAAYSIMRSMSGSYHSRPSGYYGAGYGGRSLINDSFFL